MKSHLHWALDQKTLESEIPWGSALLSERFLNDSVTPMLSTCCCFYICPVIQSRKATQLAFECCKWSSGITNCKAHWSIPMVLTLLLLTLMAFSHRTNGRTAWSGFNCGELCKFTQSICTRERTDLQWPQAVFNISWRVWGKLPGLSRGWIKSTGPPFLVFLGKVAQGSNFSEAMFLWTYFIYKIENIILIGHHSPYPREKSITRVAAQSTAGSLPFLICDSII